MLSSMLLTLLCAAPAPTPVGAAAGPTPALAAAPVLELDPTDFSTVVQGKRLAFELRAGELDTLLYHLHCLAGSTDCSREAFRAFWKRELALSAADERALLDWRTTLRRYRASLELDEDAPTRLNAPAAWDLGDKILLASLSASSLEDLRRNLGLLLAPHDAERLSAITRTFEPRFHAWWLRAGRAPASAAAKAYAALLKEKDLLPLSERALAFYGAALPDRQTVVFHVVVRPVSEAERAKPVRTVASVWENHAVIEAQEGEQPEERIAVVLRELFHFFYWARPIDARLSLLGTFAFAPEPAALGLYSIFDQAVAAALGNGLVAQRVRGPEYLTQALARERGLDDEPFVDEAAKVILRPLEKRLEQGGRMDVAFAKEYLHLTNQALGERAQSPRLLLLTRAVVLGDGKLLPLADAVGQALGGIKAEVHTADEAWPLERFPQLSGVIFLRMGQLGLLEAHPTLVPAATLAEMRELVPTSRAFASGVKRTARADLYVIAGTDEATLREALDAFLRFDQRFEGVGIVLPIKAAAARP